MSAKHDKRAVAADAGRLFVGYIPTGATGEALLIEGVRFLVWANVAFNR